MEERVINSSLLVSDNFEVIEEGFLVVAGGRIKEFGEGFEGGGMDAKDYLIMPSLINSHTHVGDSFAKEAVDGRGVLDAVGPEGVKWGLYRDVGEGLVLKGMRESIDLMLNSGITLFADFREGGERGVDTLRKALEGSDIESIILGRGIDIGYADGLGLNVYELDQVPADRGGGFVAVHAGEEKGEVSKALSCDPDIIVHATYATDDDLKEMRGRDIDVVLCPRSNAALGVGFPRVGDLIDSGVNVLLGTDNVMINSPDMFREMEFLRKYSRLHCSLTPRDVLRMATVNAAKAFSLNSGVIDVGRDADILFIDRDAVSLKGSRDVVASVVNRCSSRDVGRVMVHGEFVVDRGRG